MNRAISKLLVTLCIFATPIFQCAIYAEEIEVIVDEGEDEESTNEEIEDDIPVTFPHRSPANYSHTAIAFWNGNLLSLFFYDGGNDVTIEIYKNNVLIADTSLIVSVGDTVNFDLSGCSGGSYEVIITGIGSDTLYGYFSKRM